MSKLKFYRENAMPGTPEPDSFYAIAKTINSIDFAELYVTNGASIPRQVSGEDLVNAVIDTVKAQNNGLASLDGGGKVPVSQLPAGIGIEFEIVANIAARNALAPTKNILCLVLDASADSTVTAGNALYAYQLSTTTWHKVAEFESMDLTGLMSKWRMRANTAAAVDVVENDLVSFAGSTYIQVARSGLTFTFTLVGGAAHEHANKAVLDKLSQDADGDANYDGAPIMKWSSTAW
jgi:hypothetical protein